MITTIQIQDSVKLHLEKLKESPKETYEDVIVKLVSLAEKQKKKQRDLMIEGCKEMAKDSLQELKDWKYTEKDWD